MTVIAEMKFIRYHGQVANYLMGLTDQEPPVDERWPHAAAFVEPQIDYRRGYITAKERAKLEEELFDKLYVTKKERLKALWVRPKKPRKGAKQ